MPITQFPDPSQTGPDGILALGGDLHSDSILLAYSQGIFPWPMEGFPLAWFSPPERAILVFDELHVPRTLTRLARRQALSFTIDQAFPAVIAACAKAKRKGQKGTWITTPMKKAYIELHRLGHAHSVEAWQGERLVGGIYGVDAGGAFAGESMFHLVAGASKLALLYLVEHLRARGLEWMDIQVMTPHMEVLGAKLVKRSEFLTKLAQTRARGLRLF